MDIGRRIREARIQRQMTQSEVVGSFMTRNMLSKIENGSATPSIKTLEHISSVLGVPAGYFVGDDASAFSAEISQKAGKEIFELAQVAIEKPERARSAAVCIQSRVLLAMDDAAGAKAHLETLCGEELSDDEKNMVFCVLEECCKAASDYKGAYEYASKRILLNK